MSYLASSLCRAVFGLGEGGQDHTIHFPNYSTGTPKATGMIAIHVLTKNNSSRQEKENLLLLLVARATAQYFSTLAEEEVGLLLPISPLGPTL